MRYSIERILRGLWRQKLAYGIILVEFAMGAAIFTMCMNYLVTTRELLREYRESRVGQEIHIQGYAQEDSGEMGDTESWIVDTKDEHATETQIDYETYHAIYEKYAGDMDILFSACYVEEWLVSEEDNICAPAVVVQYMNEDMFRYLYGFDREPDKVYLGEEAYQALMTVQRAKENEEILMEPTGEDVWLEAGKLVTADGRKRSCEIVHVLNEDQEVVAKARYTEEDDLTETHTDMREVLILPVEEMQEIPEAVYDFGGLYVSANLTLIARDRAGRVDDLVPRIILELTQAKPDTMYVADQTYLEFKQQVDSLKNDTYHWLLLSVSMILMSGTGCVGYLFMQMNREKHAMAVAIAYGATYRRIVLENLITVGLVFTAGAGIGILLAPAFRGILIYTGTLQQSAEPYLILGAVVAGFTIFAVTLGIHEIHGKEIIKTLREEN